MLIKIRPFAVFRDERRSLFADQNAIGGVSVLVKRLQQHANIHHPLVGSIFGVRHKIQHSDHRLSRRGSQRQFAHGKRNRFPRPVLKNAVRFRNAFERRGRIGNPAHRTIHENAF